jgi:hypothetical protein
MANKTVGIVLDDYKIDKYKETFKEKGFEIESVTKVTKIGSLMKLTCDETKVPEIAKMCKILESTFKRRN